MATMRRGLGRGLSSLISDRSQPERHLSNLRQINPDEISSNPYQPRTDFAETELQNLAQSIKEHGILSPLIVTPQPSGGYQLIAGERRLKAAQLLKLATVPVIVRSVSEQEKLELALVENVQREDLGPLEVASAYERLKDEFGLTQEQLAQKLGRSRPQIANTLRLLHLPEPIRESLRRGEISEGQAKAILSVEDEGAQIDLWKRIGLHKLSVRSAEVEARKIKVASHSRRLRTADPEMTAVKDRLEKKLSTKVDVRGTIERGRVVIEYFSKEELEKIVCSL